ncbi:unnamed protein product [Lepidochelys olivacea]
MGYRGKCYYPSEREGSWTCSAPGASLAGIDSEQEMAFLLRHKGVYDHWIGLRREQGQPWTWANGTKFRDLLLWRWVRAGSVYVMGKEIALEGGSKWDS